jgi:amidase
MLAAQYFLTHYRGFYYAKAQNLARMLRGACDTALGKCDLLLMPTLPVKPTPLPPADAPLALYSQRAFEMVGDICPFDITRYPSMSIPCGIADGLPVGLMLTRHHYAEPTIYAAAAAFEEGADWKTL